MADLATESDLNGELRGQYLCQRHACHRGRGTYPLEVTDCSSPKTEPPARIPRCQRIRLHASQVEAPVEYLPSQLSCPRACGPVASRIARAPHLYNIHLGTHLPLFAPCRLFRHSPRASALPFPRRPSQASSISSHTVADSLHSTSFSPSFFFAIALMKSRRFIGLRMLSMSGIV